MKRRSLMATFSATTVVLGLALAAPLTANAVGTKTVGDYTGRSMYADCSGPLGTANLCGFTVGPVPVSVQARVGGYLKGSKVTATSGSAQFWYYGSAYLNGGAGHWGGGNFWTT